MPRFTLYCESTPEDDATEQIRSAGAQVIAARPGLTLIEATDEVAEQLRGQLNNWRVTQEIHANENPRRPKFAAQ